MHRLGELWVKIKFEACKLLFAEKLDSWKQALCYVALKEHYSIEDLEYILNLDKSTIYRNAKKAEENLEQTKNIDIEVDSTICLVALRGEVKNTLAASQEISKVGNTTSNVAGPTMVKTTTARQKISTDADSTIGPSRDAAEVETTAEEED